MSSGDLFNSPSSASNLGATGLRCIPPLTCSRCYQTTSWTNSATTSIRNGLRETFAFYGGAQGPEDTTVNAPKRYEAKIRAALREVSADTGVALTVAGNAAP